MSEEANEWVGGGGKNKVGEQKRLSRQAGVHVGKQAAALFSGWGEYAHSVGQGLRPACVGSAPALLECKPWRRSGAWSARGHTSKGASPCAVTAWPASSAASVRSGIRQRAAGLAPKEDVTHPHYAWHANQTGKQRGAGVAPSRRTAPARVQLAVTVT